MAFRLSEFTSKLTHGGALGSLFECEISLGKGTTGSVLDFTFMCKGVSFPASTITAATVTYMGRSLQIPGNREAAQLTTSIYNDEDMKIRNYVESWMEKLSGHSTNVRATEFSKISQYTGNLKVRQMKKDGSGSSKEYEFLDVWPSSCPEIALSWDSNDIQTFDITWEYNYWISEHSDIA
jgi:hypothetical protein